MKCPEVRPFTCVMPSYRSGRKQGAIPVTTSLLITLNVNSSTFLSLFQHGLTPRFVLWKRLRLSAKEVPPDFASAGWICKVHSHHWCPVFAPCVVVMLWKLLCEQFDTRFGPWVTRWRDFVIWTVSDDDHLFVVVFLDVAAHEQNQRLLYLLHNIYSEGSWNWFVQRKESTVTTRLKNQNISLNLKTTKAQATD